MIILIAVLAFAFAAIGVWLTVRVINRRERWAKWTLAAVLLGVPVLYLASFGPVCWITAAAPRVGRELGSTKPWMRIYFPIGAVIHRTRSENNNYVKLWITWGATRNGSVHVPTDASGKNWYGFTQGE